MTRFTPLFAAACALAIAAPALAEDPKPAMRATATATAAEPQKAAPNPNQRICFRDTLTGSHVPRTACKTRAEWTREGVTVPAQ